MAITIIGLGPGDPALLTRQAWDILSGSRELYVRTAGHSVVAALPPVVQIHSYEAAFETMDDLVAIHNRIAEELVALGKRPQGVLFAVPGHPLVDEGSVPPILALARQGGVPVHLVDGVSFVERTLSLLDGTVPVGLQLVDATELAGSHYPPVNPDRPTLVGRIRDLRLLPDIRRVLLMAYSADHPVTLVQVDGAGRGQVRTVHLSELDRCLPTMLGAVVYVPSLAHAGGLPSFQDTVARLRAPDGCPWDREQTHLSLRNNLLEEAYEVLAALDVGDDGMMCEELGDLLMQIAMHVQIATERGGFLFADVIGAIDAKLKRRHPHVFGDVEVNGTADVLRNWEAIKAGERKVGGSEHASRLDGVPTILPSLARAQALGERAARAGFDWPDVEGVLDKLREEVAELRNAQDLQSQEQEFGDILFSLANVARWLQVDAEGALRGACDRFTRRYGDMERDTAGRGIDLSSLSLSEQDALWEQAKKLPVQGENE